MDLANGNGTFGDDTGVVDAPSFFDSPEVADFIFDLELKDIFDEPEKLPQQDGPPGNVPTEGSLSTGNSGTSDGGNASEAAVESTITLDEDYIVHHLIIHGEPNLHDVSEAGREKLDQFVSAAAKDTRFEEYSALPDALLYQSRRNKHNDWSDLSKWEMYCIYLRVSIHGQVFGIRHLRGLREDLKDVHGAIKMALHPRCRMVRDHRLKDDIKFYLTMSVGIFVGGIGLRYRVIITDWEDITGMTRNMPFLEKLAIYDENGGWKTTLGGLETAIMSAKFRQRATRLLVYMLMICVHKKDDRRRDFFLLLQEGLVGEELYQRLWSTGQLIVKELDEWCLEYTNERIQPHLPDGRKHYINIPEDQEELTRQRYILPRVLRCWLRSDNEEFDSDEESLASSTDNDGSNDGSGDADEAGNNDASGDGDDGNKDPEDFGDVPFGGNNDGGVLAGGDNHGSDSFGDDHDEEVDDPFIECLMHKLAEIGVAEEDTAVYYGLVEGVCSIRPVDCTCDDELIESFTRMVRVTMNK